MQLFRKPPKTTLNEIHDFVQDITMLRVERDHALEQGNTEEAELLTANIKSANRALDYLLEKLG